MTESQGSENVIVNPDGNLGPVPQRPSSEQSLEELEQHCLANPWFYPKLESNQRKGKELYGYMIRCHDIWDQGTEQPGVEEGDEVDGVSAEPGSSESVAKASVRFRDPEISETVTLEPETSDVLAEPSGLAGTEEPSSSPCQIELPSQANPSRSTDPDGGMVPEPTDAPSAASSSQPTEQRSSPKEPSGDQTSDLSSRLPHSSPTNPIGAARINAPQPTPRGRTRTQAEANRAQINAVRGPANIQGNTNCTFPVWGSVANVQNNVNCTINQYETVPLPNPAPKRMFGSTGHRIVCPFLETCGSMECLDARTHLREKYGRATSRELIVSEVRDKVSSPWPLIVCATFPLTVPSPRSIWSK
jgi:hypothetical protein